MTANPRTAAALRIAEIATIKVAIKELGIDDDTYRAMLVQLTGKRSCADLSWQERKRVIDHLKTKGFKIRARKLPAAHKSLALSKEAIEAKIALQLKALGQNWPYAYGVGRRIFPQIGRFEFLTAEQLGDVSSALERTIRFKARKAQAV